jgi:hypothetical protein
LNKSSYHFLLQVQATSDEIDHSKNLLHFSVWLGILVIGYSRSSFTDRFGNGLVGDGTDYPSFIFVVFTCFGDFLFSLVYATLAL